MILAIDIGNSNITIGGFNDDKLLFVSRISTDPLRTVDEYSVRILESLSLYKMNSKNIEGSIIASVVPPLNAVISESIRFITGNAPLIVGPGIKSGIGIRCDIPSSVGADLVAASVAAHFIYGSPSLIIDIGTATKMTVVDNKGAFIGTSIIPGVIMGLDALAEKTAQLPKISLEMPATVIAKNTADCMRSGVLFGNACMIDGMIDRINDEFGESLNVYATGGLADTIIPLCKHNIRVDDNLVLKGLSILYKKNKPN